MRYTSRQLEGGRPSSVQDGKKFMAAKWSVSCVFQIQTPARNIVELPCGCWEPHGTFVYSCRGHSPGLINFRYFKKRARSKLNCTIKKYGLYAFNVLHIPSSIQLRWLCVYVCMCVFVCVRVCACSRCLSKNGRQGLNTLKASFSMRHPLA